MSFGGDDRPSRDERDAANRSNELLKKQNELLKQQEVEKAQREKQLEQQRIAALRGRFSMAGGGSGGGVSDASLYSRITGR